MPGDTEVPRLAHPAVGPSNVRDLRVETTEEHDEPWQPNWPDGTERIVLGRDPSTGGSLTLLRFPAGYDRQDEARIHKVGGAPRFEYHSCHEEIVSLEGDYVFGDPLLYDFGARSYLNHPPYWLHPARQRSEAGVLLLVRNSHPVDFGFCDIPHEWDGVESYLDASHVKASDSHGVTSLDLDAAELRPVSEHGAPLDGVRGLRLWTDEVLGWETWLVDASPGVTLARPGDSDRAGDEWFVLEGSLLTEATGGRSELEPYGHWCDPSRYPVGGSVLVSGQAGVRALRWVVSGVLSEH